MKALKIIFKSILVILALATILIIVTGRSYLFKGVYNTYLKGRTMPSATEYQIFDNRV